MAHRGNDRVDVYTDGACSNNGRGNSAAGWGVNFGPDHPWNESGPVSGRATNNNAEIEAARRAVEIAGRNGVRDLNIRTDSRFLIDSHNNYMPKWKENGYRTYSGEPVKNTEQFQALDKAIRNNPDMDVRFEHVRGHAGNSGNEGADRMARDGAKQYRQNHHRY